MMRVDFHSATFPPLAFPLSHRLGAMLPLLKSGGPSVSLNWIPSSLKCPAGEANATYLFVLP